MKFLKRYVFRFVRLFTLQSADFSDNLTRYQVRPLIISYSPTLDTDCTLNICMANCSQSASVSVIVIIDSLWELILIPRTLSFTHCTYHRRSSKDTYVFSKYQYKDPDPQNLHGFRTLVFPSVT